MVKLEVFAGICGFTTVIHAEDQTGYKASCRLESDCPNCVKLSAALENESLNVMNELFKRDLSRVIEAAAGTLPHVSCPVVPSILKALEVSVGLALPKDATITFIQ